MRLIFTALALAVGLVVVDAPEARAQEGAVVGSYELVRVAGSALPAVIERDRRCVEEVVSGTLRLDADGEWEFDYLERETCGSDVDEDWEDEDGDYIVRGGTITFSDDTERYDPDDLDIDELGTGVLNGNELRVILEDGRTELTFRR